MYGERTVWNPNARDRGQDATHVTANTTLLRRPRSRLRANASRADASGKISTDGRRSAPASASLAIDRSWSRFGSTVKYSPPSGGSCATETSRPPGRSTAPDRRSRSPPTVSNTRSTGATASSKRVAASTASCAPSSRTRSSSPAAAVPTTCAPRVRASWTASPPTAPAAPWISTRSPAASRPWSNRPCQAVSAGRGIAALSLPALTAWQGLFDHGRLAAGERVLIHGAAGAVGGLAVQLARTRGAHVVGTAAAGELERVRELGAHEAVDAATRFEDAVAPVDLVFDTVGGERLRRSGAVLRPGGRLVSVAQEPPDGGEYFTVEPNRDQLRSIARLADAGALRRPSVEIFPLTSAREAFARSLERGRRGKVVLAVT